MKKILLAILSLAALNCFAQKWIAHKVDTSLMVTIPEGYTIIDTLEQHIIRAPIANALVMIQTLKNAGQTATNIQSKDELIKNYKEFQKGLVGAQHGKLLTQKMVTKDGLYMTEFSFTASANEEKQIRHFLTVFFNETWYTISFWEVSAMSPELKGDREKLFSSVKFPAGSSLKNQLSYSVEGSVAYKNGYIIGRLLGFVVVIGAVVGLIVWVSKRGRRKK